MNSEPRDAANETDLARFHETHMDDESLWKKPGKTIRSRRGQGPSVTFTIRLTGEELTRISQAAFARGTTPSDFIRSAALRALEDPDRRRMDQEARLRHLREKVKELEVAVNEL